MPFGFVLDKDDPSKLEWWDINGPTDLTTDQAMVIAVSGIAAALNRIADELNRAQLPMQELANAVTGMSQER